jgi:hypothetical protein
MMTPIELTQWHEIGNKLTKYLEICDCQRKLKSIISNLASIYDKCISKDYIFTGAEWLLLAMIERYDFVNHGTNAEYPIINQEHEFWKFILDANSLSFLQDN